MKKQAICTILSLFLSIGIFAQQQISTSIYFETAKAELTEQSKKELNEFTQRLKNHGDYSLEVKAHTDNRGDDAYNMNLSNQRSNSVMSYLSTLAIESSKSTAAFFGESRPDFSNETEEGMQKNRRVDLFATVFSIENMEDLMERLSENNEQEYQFSANENIKLTALNGTKIWIPANAFVNENGEVVSGEINFRMREAYSSLDIISNGLSTLSGEKLLETGGMIHMEAESEGQKLQLNKDINLLIEMPTEKTKDGMQLFTGNPSDDGVVDWASTGQEFKTDEKDYLSYPPMPKPKYSHKSFPPYECNVDIRPQAPKKPRKPVEPREPKREQFKYNPGFLKSVTLGKKGIKAEEERRYESALANYKNRHEKYTNISKPRYEEELVAYKEKTAHYKEADLEWSTNCRSEREEYLKTMRAEFEKEDSLARVNYQVQIKLWRKAKKKIAEEFEEKYNEVGTLNKKALSSYFYQVNKLGWINCDRFINIPKSSMMLANIKTSSPSLEEMVYIVFEDEKTMIRPRRIQNGGFQFNLPVGKKVSILGIKVENGRPQMAKLNTHIQREKEYVLDYKSITLKDMRRQLEALGS